jgi:hypothetical protein
MTSVLVVSAMRIAPSSGTVTALARMKDWRALRDYRRRAATLIDAVRAVELLALNCSF